MADGMIAALPQMAAKALEETRPSHQPSGPAGGGAEFAATLAAALSGRTGNGVGAAQPAAEAAVAVAQPQPANIMIPQDGAAQDGAAQDETNATPDAASAEADTTLAVPAPQPLAAPAPPAAAATASMALAVPFVVPETARAEAARRLEASGLSGADAITDGGSPAGAGRPATGAAVKTAGPPQAAAPQAGNVATAGADVSQPGTGAEAAPRTARGATDLPGAVPTGSGAAAETAREPLLGADNLVAAQPLQQPEPSLRGASQPGAAQPAALLVPTQQDAGGRSLTPTAAPPEPPRPAAPPSAQPDRGAIGFASDPARQSFDLRLDTSTLGKVEVEVRQAGGAAEVVVRTERPDTLMALARDGADLDRALRDAGIGPEGRSMSFQLGSGGDGQAGQRQRGPGARLAPADQMQGNGASGPYRSPLSLIDIHV